MTPLSPIPDILLTRGLPAVLEIVNQARAAVLKVSTRSRLDPGALINRARAAVARYEPLFASAMKDSLLVGWLESARDTAAKAQRVVPPPTDQPEPFIEPPPPERITTFRPEDPEPVIRYPQIEQAVRYLGEKRALTQADFDALDQDARRTAFTVARVQSADAVAKIQAAVIRDVQDGGTLTEFRENVAEAVNGALSAPQVETIYRTQVLQAVGAGKREILRDPIINDAFPYVLWTSTHDSRTRPDHLAMEKHGQNGTAVYRLDDPIWQTCWPPCAWQCRCHAIALSLSDAARHGSLEAKRWLETGIPPESPEYARTPYPVKIPPGWPTNDRIVSVI